jgi:hypothetical protein
MGQLYDSVNKVDAIIKNAGLEGKEFFNAKGKISMKAGFVLSTIKPETPDDPTKIAALKAAVKLVLGKTL